MLVQRAINNIIKNSKNSKIRNMTDKIVVETNLGRLRGNSFEDYHGGNFLGFLGVPYAKAPVGNLRFKAPEPPEPWEGIKDATKNGPECPSWDMMFWYFVGQEDNCLNLNIFTKELPNNSRQFKKKPVMVWIHGGGFMAGSNNIEMYGPHYLMTEDIVLVAPNYRLGVLGFLSLKDPTLEVPGNAGLKDQVMALKWVQNNIEKFGGDPNNVTIFGESAGGASVHYLTLSPITKGLFHKAIIQSGCALHLWSHGKNNALEIAGAMGYKETDEKTILEKLRKEGVRKLVNGQHKIKDHIEAGIVRPFGVVIEPPSKDAILSKTPLEILKAGEQHQIPMIVGYNSMEGLLYEVLRKAYFLKYPTTFERDIPLDLRIELNSPQSKELDEKIRTFYFGKGQQPVNNIKKIYEIKSDTNFTYKILKSIELLNETSTQPIYPYRMSLVTSLNVFKKLTMSPYFLPTHFLNLLAKVSYHYVPYFQPWFQWMASKMPENSTVEGACHADDLFYLFKTMLNPEIKIGSKEDKYVQRFVRLWTNFASTGDPTPPEDEVMGLERWRSLDDLGLAILDIGEELRVVSNEDDQRRKKFWDSVYQSYGKK